jgi:hypothetical protein
MYTESDATPGSLWRHKKGGFYVVVGISQCSTNGNEQERCVVYWSIKYKGLRHRKAEEFLDGRFTLVPDITGE